VLGEGDDITCLEYIKKHKKETGPALVGIELKTKEDYEALLANLGKYNINYTELKKDDNAFGYLV
jgi:threonine dehydratase